MSNRLPLVLSVTALVVAVLGATPVGNAAMNLVVPRNSVGTLQLKANAVTEAGAVENTGTGGSGVADQPGACSMGTSCANLRSEWVAGRSLVESKRRQTSLAFAIAHRLE